MTLLSITPTKRARRGFTLIETAVAQVIVTFAITAICQLLAAGTQANAAGTELTTAVNLANTIHEISIGLPFSNTAEPNPETLRDIWDLNGLSFSPAIDGNRHPLPGFEHWTQTVSVKTVNANDVSLELPQNKKAPTAKLAVSTYHDGRLVYVGNWLFMAEPLK